MDSRYILGTRVDVTTYDQAWEMFGTWIAQEQWGYVVAANVHVVMSGVWQRAFQRVVNQAALVTADGMPLVWALKALGVKNPQRVYGPDLILAGCAWAEKNGNAIYLYGSDENGLSQLQARLLHQFPALIIAGSHAPPFQSRFPAHDLALIQDCERIAASGAKIVFVGLGCPKQEYWLADYAPLIPAIVLGVGAAFAFHSGQVKQAPRWMMGLGLEWLFRFSQEPRRLWQRYLLNNPMFVILLAWQLLRKNRQ
ncbi:WecB/TagA/CpsF family glycosyltransferase [Thermosynechococcaceae cyanobacterium BACA0444]|uniref:WecB/TagA/CpsF family glycosyltransferase n=1 Tax=Pseudocalidococcus azoricus BACA0444 TaxID=2918990 RepID=A0AAE4JZD7_9CYAN|nr:WecB/TagA/CpsF family glycosyltransferase [Pseudocalidococcus azoricus]MDS3860697.1 WecB/TagA/CpsF family glycosyltransferase [Pseudocalidococcus azoricus BACA0444]